MVTSCIPQLSAPVSICPHLLSLSPYICLKVPCRHLKVTGWATVAPFLGRCPSKPASAGPFLQGQGRTLSSGGGPSCPFRNQTPVAFRLLEKLQAGRVLLASPRWCRPGVPCACRNSLRLSCPQHHLPSGLLLVALVGSGSRVSLSSRTPHPRRDPSGRCSCPLSSCPPDSLCPAGILEGPGPAKSEESFPMVGG